MNKYLIIYHEWFISSKGFEKEIIQKENYKKAKEYANNKCFQKQDNFNHVDCIVIKLSTGILVD